MKNNACRLRVRAIRRLSLLASLYLFCGSFTAPAQSVSPAERPDRGVSPVGSYSISDIENINLTNGNLNLSIPLASLPPIAGSKLSWVLSAVYNSKIHNFATSEELADGDIHPSNYTVKELQLTSGGWQVGAGYGLGFQDSIQDFHPADAGCIDPGCTNPAYRKKAFLTTPDGASHELRPLDYPAYSAGEGWRYGYYKDTPATTNSTMRYYSFDGSFLWAKVDPFPLFGSPNSWTVYLPDGTQINYLNGVEKIIDTNGNAINIYTETDGVVFTTHYQDLQSQTPGPIREIRQIYNSASNTSQVQYQTVGGAWVTIDINYGVTTIQGLTYNIGDHRCPFVAAFNDLGDIPVVRSIILPQTQSGPRRQFTFSYNSDTLDSVNVQWQPGCRSPSLTITTASHGWGYLSQMVMPSGAQVNYTYSLDGKPEPVNPARELTREIVTQKTIVHDEVSDTWTYTNSGAIASVTGPDGTVTTESFYPHDPALAQSIAGSDGKGGLVYRTNKSNKVLMERHWTLMIFSGASTVSPGGMVSFNPVVDAEYTSLLDSGGNPIKMSAKTFQYDFNGALTQETDYDWFDPALVTRDSNGVPTAAPVGAATLRIITNNYYNPATSPASENVYAKRTLPSAAPLILKALQQTAVGASQTRYSYDNQGYGVAPTIGNLTMVSKWDDQSDAWRNTTYGYDSYGNRTSITDPNNNVTNIAFDPATHAQPTQVTVNPLNGTGTQTITTVYDYWTGLVTSVTDPNNQTTTTSYINQLLGEVDPLGRPGVVTGPPVNSVVDGVTYAGQQRKVKTTYFDDARQVVLESDLNQTGDYKLKSRASYDQLGRVINTESNEDGSANYSISTETVYVQMGLITLSSNPKRSAAAATEGWTRATRDTLGRVIEVATFSGATRPPNVGTNSDWTGSVTTNYTGNQTTVTDQAGKKRRSETDALGRLVKVTEDPGGLNNETTYFYDPLDNVRYVQQGAQGRWFSYDSLSRLIRVRNPEQNCNPNLPPHTDPFTGGSCWSTAHSYDANDNITKKVDARGVVTNYSYDALNRNTGIDYVNGSQTSAVRRVYDGAVNGKGRLHYVWTQEGGVNATHTAIDSYDALGRALTKRQHFWRGNDWGTPYAVQQGYDLAGNVKTVTYPSGHTVTYSHDQAGRLSGFTGNLGDGVNRNYATGMQYDAAGLMKREQFGTAIPLYHRRHYNNRGQVFDIRLGTDPNTAYDSDDLGAWQDAAGSWNRGALRLYYSTLDGCHVYGNGGTDNNDNLLRMDHHIPLDDAVSNSVASIDRYDYDPLDRLKGVTELSYTRGPSGNDIYQGVFQQAFLYDQWGNRTIDQDNTTGGVNEKTYTVDAATNRLTSVDGVTMSYDAAGNQINDGSGERVYDGENRLVEAKNHEGVRVSWYVYDAEGRRVVRMVGTQGTWQVYGIGGELLAEYAVDAAPSAAQKEYGYRDGQLLITAESNGTVKWLVADHMGSTRMVVDKTGALVDDPGTVAVHEGVIRHDYLPFGEEVGANVGIRTATNGYAGDTTRQRLTGKERDDETGFDYFGARYYSNVQGRFTGVDQGNADAIDPQTWNRYAYVTNNPLKFIDPDGHTKRAAKQPFVNQALNDNNKTRGLRDAMIAAVNYSRGALEEDYLEGKPFKNFNILKGLAGEAIMHEGLSKVLPFATISYQPGIGTADLSVSARLVLKDTGIILHNLLRNVSQTRSKEFDMYVREAVFEVKTGVSLKDVLKGVEQAILNAQAGGISTVSVLAIDRKAWEAVVKSGKAADVLRKTGRNGVYIMLVDGLADEAENRMKDLIKRIRKHHEEYCRKNRCQ